MRLLFFFIFLACTTMAFAQANISGVVTVGAAQIPGEDIHVWGISAPGTGMGYYTSDYTYNSGAYTLNVNIPNGQTIDYYVKVFDICTGDTLVHSLTLEAQQYTILDMNICADINFPSDSVLCNADFDYTVDADNYKEVTFTNLSYSNMPDFAHFTWAFGDGEVSYLESPVHEYEEEGDYLVTLIVDSPACSDTIQKWVYLDCDCFGEGDDPVCVISGQDSIGNDILTQYANMCFAACDGYEESDVVACEEYQEPCQDCPTTYDPVCVNVASDACFDPIIITFPNECWAACNGYTAAQFVDCEVTNEDCVVSLQYEIIEYLPSGYVLVEIKATPSVVGYVEDHTWNTNGYNYSWVGTNRIQIAYPGEGDYTVDLSLITNYNCIASASIDINIEDDCDCDEGYNPVCIQTELDDFPYTAIDTFVNMCYVECAGYTAEDIVDCGTPIVACNIINLNYTILSDTLGVQDGSVWIAANVQYVGGAISEWHWDLGDGTTSDTPQEFLYHYPNNGTYTVTLTITTVAGCTSTLSMDVIVDIEDGINASVEANIDNQVTILPNPTADYIQIAWNAEMSSNIADVKILDLNGIEVHTTSVALNEQSLTEEINMAHLTDGVYFVEIMVGEIMVVKKVIRN